MLYEEDIEKWDFFEIILSENEYEKIREGGLTVDFKGGLHDVRNLNVYLRIDKNYNEEQ